MSPARRPRRMVVLVVILVVAVGVGAASAFPLRTLFDQRSAIAASESELAALEAELETLEARVDALDTPGEIERLARDRYSMVRPGEEPYAILPVAREPLSIPPGWPFTSDPLQAG